MPPAVAAAQPEAWASRASGPTLTNSIHIFNVLTGGEIARLDAPNAICVGTGAMTPDRRSFIVPVTGGLARIDTRTRRLAEVIPRPGDCAGWIRIANSGRWWYVRTDSEYQILDAASRRLVRQEPASDVVAIDFDTSRFFELRDTGAATVIQAWTQETTGVAPAPVWTRTLPGIPLRDLAVDGDNVYLVVRQSAIETLYRLDATTGEPLAQRAVDATPRGITYFNNLVYLASDAFAIHAYRADTFELFTTSDRGSVGTIREMFVDTENNTLYVVSMGVTSIPKPFSVTYLTAYDVASLRMERTAPLSPSGGMFLAAPSGVGLGDVMPPRPVRITGLDMERSAFRVRWQPNAAGPAPWSFEIRAARRGESPVAVVSLDASARDWASPVLPPGSYILQVVARNGVGDGEASRVVDIGIDQTVVPDRPRSPSIEIHETTVKMDWGRADTGPSPAGYWIEASHDSTTAFVPVATTTLPEFSAVNVPAGAWWVRVRGITAGGTSPPSVANAFSAAPCMASPAEPYALAALTTENMVTLQWNAPTPSPEYLMEVTTYAGRTVRFQFEVAGPHAALEMTAPAGVYLVQVRARNACGTSAPSNAVVVSVP